jgi:hypothetical protein
VQLKNGSVFAAGGENDDGSIFSSTRDAKFCGQNPHIDIRCYNVRAVATTPTTTGGITSGTNTLALASASGFQNGDGIVVRRAGATLSISTPAAPTVVASNASGLIGTGITAANSTGTTTWQYCIAARTIGGGLTPCSPTASISNGAATLGKGTVTISSWSRSTGGVVTVTTSAAHNLVNNALINITGDNDIAGWYQVATATPGTTTFSFVHGNLSENGARTSGGSTGTVNWFVGNHISWASVTGAYEYLIYNVGTGALVGVSLPDTALFGGFSLLSDPLYNNIDDFGSPITTAPGQPDWVPTGAPPAVAKNEDLVTTIVSGAGTTTLTLAANAVNTVAGATVKFDNVPNIVAAINAVFTGDQKGILYFPATSGINNGYVTNSYLNMATFPSIVGIIQAGPIFPGDTIQINSTQWTGWPHNPLKTTSFASEAYPRITSSTAYPMIYAVKPNTLSLAYLSIENNSANAGALYVQDAGGFSNTFDHLNFMTAGNSDFSSRHMIFRNNILNAGVFSFTRIAMIAGPLISDNSPVPLFQVTQGFSPFSFDHIFLNRRGIYLGAAPTGLQGTVDFIYEQGAIMPKVTLANTTGAGSVAISLDYRNSIEDTTTQPVITYFGGNMTGTIRFFGSNGLAGNAIVAGNGSLGLQVNGVGVPNGNVGQNQNVKIGPITSAALDGIINTANSRNIAKEVFSGSYSIGSRYQFFVDSLPQQAPTCAVSAGGSVRLASYNFKLAPVFSTGGEGSASSASLNCTTTRGNQTVTITWTSVPGAIGYDIYKATDGINFLAFQCAPPFVAGGGTTSFVWAGTGACGNYGMPRFTGSGPTSLSAAGVSAPQLTLPSSDGGGNVIVKMPVGTATRTLNLPDATGTALLGKGWFTNPNHLLITRADGIVEDSGVAPMAVFDSGNRANGTIQSGNPNWVNHANFSGGVNIVGNRFVGGTGGTSGWVLYTGASFPTDDQTVAATITGVGASANASTSILLRASPMVGTGYSCSYSVNGTSNLSIGKEVRGTFTSLSSLNYSAVAGDKLSCNVTGRTLNLYVNGVRKIGPITDASISSGFPGLGFFSNLSSLTLSNWAASYGAVSLNVAQTWSQLQTFASGVKLGATQSLNGAGGNAAIVTTQSAPLTTGKVVVGDANNSASPAGGSGTLGVTIPRKMLIIGALCNNATARPVWSMPTSGAPTANCNTGRNVQEATLDFADGNSAQYSLYLPSDWTGAIDARLMFFDSATSGTVIFQIATACTATSGSTNDDLAFNTTDSFSTITLNATANALWEATKLSINTTGCQPGNKLQIKITRATDTAAGAARFSALELTTRAAI